MVRMSVYYPNQPDAHFDHTYYATKHRKLVEDSLKPLGLRRVEIERGVAGFAGGPAPYVSVGHLIFDSMDALGAAWAVGGDAIVADVPNYTNAQPVVQISEVVSA